MHPSEQDRLLREILDDEKIAALRASSLAEMLRTSRRRRRRRVLLASAGTSVAILMTLLVLVRRDARAPVSVAAAPAAKSVAVRMISDQQLLALFPDRSVALIGRTGEQRLVFLDAENQARPASENARNGPR